jgi:hypothetical protein
MLNLLSRFSTNSSIPNFMKILPVSAEVFHADGKTEAQNHTQTGMTKLIVGFRVSTNRPKNCSHPVNNL